MMSRIGSKWCSVTPPSTRPASTSWMTYGESSPAARISASRVRISSRSVSASNGGNREGGRDRVHVVFRREAHEQLVDAHLVGVGVRRELSGGGVGTAHGRC